MANTLTLTNFTELLYAAKDIVAAEPCAFANSVIVNSGSEGISINGTVSSFKTAVPTVDTSAYTPSMSLPSSQDLTVSTDTMTLDQVARVSIPLSGETMKQLDNTAGREAVVNDLLAQAVRALRNTIEAHIGTVAAKGCSRAFGTAATTPFGSNHDSINEVRQILFDNGAPLNDGMISLVINSVASTKLRNLTNLYKVNEAGSSALLRQGILQDISGIMVKESAGVSATTAGAMTGALFNGAGAVGDTTITFDTGTVNTTGIVAGDVLTVGSQKYVVNVGTTSTSGTFTIQAPGLRAVVADNTAITVNATSTRNVLFHKNAIELAIRPFALPPTGDAGEHTTITDSKTGLVFDAGLYRGDGLATLRLMCLYKAKVWKPEFCAALLG